MTTKSFFGYFPLVLLALGCISITGCDGCAFAECIGGAEHSFEQKVLFEPEQSQYHIGDTIIISSKFSCRGLLNTATGLTEDYCGFKDLGSSISIHLLYHFPTDSIDFVYVQENFDYISIEGETKSLNRYASDINFQIKDDEYRFKIGIIPKIVGKYAVFISDSGPVRLPGSDRCDTGVFGLINSNTDNHIELIQEYFAGAMVSDFDKTHNYCFEVIP